MLGEATAASLGLPENVTVIPAAIWGIQEKHGPSRVIFGPPVDKSGLEGPRSQQAGELALRMMAAERGPDRRAAVPSRSVATRVASAQA